VGTQDSDEARRLDSEELQHGDPDHDEHAVPCEARREHGDERVDAMRDGQQAAHEPLRQARKVPADEE
jgi:hypothetical protein